MPKGKKKVEPLKELFVLYRNDGVMFATWESLQEAIEDAVGPAFRPTYTIQRFVPDGSRPIRKKG